MGISTRRGNSIALVVRLPTVVHFIHVMAPITFGWGVKHLSRFSGVSQASLKRFPGLLIHFP
jgi:hypothetical protein